MTTNSYEQDKLKESVKSLDHALKFLPDAKKDAFYFSGISKSFEVCLEYAWKHLKKRCVDEGVEVYSPKEIIKVAGRLKFIDNVEEWLGFLKDRNLAVHDYIGVSDGDYLKTIKAFYKEVKKLV